MTTFEILQRIHQVFTNTNKFILKLIIIIIMLLVCLGYRLFKAAMFITGFVFGASIVYFFCVETRFLPAAGQIGLAVGSGLLCGLISMLIIYAGLFVTGFSFGAPLAIVIFVIVEQFHHPAARWVPIGVTLSIGLLFGIAAMVRWQKVCIVVGTSWLGSALMLCTIDYYVNLFRSSLYSYAVMTIVDVDIADNERMCWFSWIFFACWPVLFAIGFVIQWRLTAAKFDHLSRRGTGNHS